MKKILLSFCAIFLGVFPLPASDSIEGLLEDIEKKNDLSKKTKLENSGYSTIYTRNDLDMMQVKYLRDILKYSFDGYSESRYGLPNPLNIGNIPFSSSLVRVFIDDQEITTSMYGSGLILTGDLDLSFVDHIEVYTHSTSFVFSTEPTSTLIRMFSKKADRDGGGSVKVEVSSRGGSTQNIQYIDTYNEMQYLARASYSNDERKTYATSEDDLNRDVKRYNLFASARSETDAFLLNASKSDKGGWLGPSLDTSLNTSTISFKDAHVGYAKSLGDFKLSLAYDTLKDHVLYAATPLMMYGITPINRFESESDSSVITTEMKYTKQIDHHHFIAGLKYRYKAFELDKIQMNGIDMPLYGHTRQAVGSAFVEDSYAMYDNLILTLGLQASQVKNNGNVEDDTVSMGRAGITYTTDNWTSKSFVFHNESYADPYLINSFYVLSAIPKNQVTDTLAQEIKYEKDASLYEFFISYSWVDNAFFMNDTGLIDTALKQSTYLNQLLRYTYFYGNVDKISLAYMYQNIDHAGYQTTFENHHITVRHQHRFGKFDFFEELFLGRNIKEHQTSYDVTLGLRYHVNDDFSFTLKGQNLLNKAEKQYFSTVDISTFQPTEPFGAPVQERMVVLGFEWLF